MSHRFLRHRLVLPVVATALFAGTTALADDNDPRVTEQRLAALESTPERKVLIAEPAAQARKTVGRVRQAHTAGDVPFALELGALAKEQADLAADVIRAAEIEAELAKVQTQLTEVEQKRRRTETLLEETVAHRERTKQQLLRIKADKAAQQKPVPGKGNDISSTAKAPPAKAAPAKADASKQQVKP